MSYSPKYDYAAKDSLPSGNSLKVIRGTELTEEFKAISENLIQTDSNVVEVNTRLDSLSSNVNGNVASCYYSPGYEPGADGVVGLVYGHNIDRIEVAGNDELPQTRVYFSEEFSDVDSNGMPSHFAFNFTPVDGSGSPVSLKISSADANYVAFIAWKWLDNDWVPIPGKDLAFTLIVVDMAKGQ